jgi:predicted component of type VI protein secretion system
MEKIEIETRDGLQRIPLDKPRITIGRLPGNDIVLPYTQISRHHAEIRQRGDDWWIIDLGSTNGLRVGGRQVKEHLLRGGDRVTLAPTIYVHFISDRPVQPMMVEGSTMELAAVPAPPSPAASSAAREIAEPAATPADDLAAAAAVPAPRRRMGMVPPPGIAHAPTPTHLVGSPPSGPPRPRPGPPSPTPQVDEQDLWLLGDSPAATQQHVPATPEATIVETPPAAGISQRPPPPARDLPLSSPFALMRQQQKPTQTLPRRPILITCPTCGASTAPDSPYCWSCRETIARPCPQCGLFLLPIQANCPRCASPNPHAVKR